MSVIANRVKMSTSTIGTGTIDLDAAETGYQSFTDGGITNGQVVSYAIEDGAAWEIGTGTYTTGTPDTLSRTVIESSNSDAAINLSGSAVVFVTALSGDLQNAVDMDQGVATTDSPSFAGLTATTADINGGTIDGTVIGGSTPAAISGTTGTFSSALTGTDLTLSGGVYLGGTGSANYLDDYEEGTWTPQVRGSGTAGTYTYNVQKGTYSKIGNIVTADFALLNIVVSSAGTGYIQIRGLPFLKAGDAYPVGALNLSSMNWGALVTSAVLSFTSGSATDVLYMRAIGSNSSGLDILTSAISSGNSGIQGSITYVV